MGARKSKYSIPQPPRKVKPVSGMALNLYCPQGQFPGMRSYLVLGTHVKTGITLYYVPQLTMVRIPWREWDRIHNVKPYDYDPAALSKLIGERQAIYDKLGLRYSKSNMQRALRVLACGGRCPEPPKEELNL